MLRQLTRLVLLAAISVVSSASSGFAQESTPKTEWSRYLAVNTVTAEVRKVDGNNVTLRVYYMEAEATKSSSGGNRSSSRSRSRNGRNQNPIQRLIQQAKSNQPKIQYHQEHHDYNIGYFADTRVTGKVPTSQDESGKSLPPTPLSLTPGMVVQAALVRDKSIPLASFTEKDLNARSFHVVGTNPNYKEDSGTKSSPKKK